MSVVCKSSDVATGQLRGVELYGVKVGIANVGGVFYAFSDACPHEGCSLSEGQLGESSVTCRCGSQYDLASGRVLSGPAARRVRTYHVQMDGDDISI